MVPRLQRAVIVLMLAAFSYWFLYASGESQGSSLYDEPIMTDPNLYDFSKNDRYDLVLGASLDTTVEYRVRGIRIDNLSNSWLRLPDLNRYVPPLTMGWQSIVLDPTTRIRVEFSDAPPGGIPSELTGNNPVVEVYGWIVPEKAGISLGSVSASVSLVIAGLPGNGILTYANPSVFPINQAGVPPYWPLVLAPGDGNYLGISFWQAICNDDLTTETKVWLIAGNNAGPNQFVDVLTISPAHPMAFHDFYPRILRFDDNSGTNPDPTDIRGWPTSSDAGQQDIQITLQWTTLTRSP